MELTQGDLRETGIIRYSFSGHETFPFRYTWLPKGVQELARNSSLFSEDEAMVTLGVGKNMVKSIRHWCEALSLIEPTERGQGMRPTLLGNALFSHEGWDPYLEDPATLWLLHWLLVSRRDRASTWYLTFTQFNVDLFKSKDLADWLMKTIKPNQNARATSASLKRDVEVFLRTYTPSRTTKPALLSEDTFDCPLVELGLLREVEHGLYQFIRGPKPSLPTVNFVYALMDFWEKTAPQQQALSFEHILYGQGSPGGAFKLSENALVERLETLPRWTHLTFSDTAGRRQVLRHGTNTRMDRLAILRRHYHGSSERVRP
jgi:hypothetical protein